MQTERTTLQYTVISIRHWWRRSASSWLWEHCATTYCTAVLSLQYIRTAGAAAAKVATTSDWKCESVWKGENGSCVGRVFLAKYTWNHFEANHSLKSCVCHCLSPPFLPNTGLRQVAWTPHFCAAASNVSRLVLAPASNSLNEASRLNFFAGLCWCNSSCIRHARVTLFYSPIYPNH